jgi:hypothetical protein
LRYNILLGRETTLDKRETRCLQATHILEGACAAAHLLHHIFKAAFAASTLGLLREEAELALLGYIAQSAQLLDRLLTSRLLAAADNATTLSLHQILLVETTGGVLGSAMEHLGLGSYSLHMATTSHVVTARVATVLARVATSISHF